MVAKYETTQYQFSNNFNTRNMSEKLQSPQSNIVDVSNSCLICGKELDKETAEHGNGTCSEYCNAKYSGYPMPHDYFEGLQMLVDNCC